ncbi:CRISPR-associated endoribonuclease Cas6 [Parapedobacter sp. ISTM3]|uniref:CRISPR-associated endoribonuclease Cas6 n=1 Tax=Parapedobacter sp. ISTM3 TaxID=2800130 RepID=UPI00190656B7|nr:CRISPR-associated endoribonuclease Cas6 [Parapedobacter sp. ISTM3]MBK1440757.1 CRISPR-associated endoribonuclease Cas6 [Parapedobacter sp. ISTM3]
MRIYITLSKNKELIPFNYQHLLTGVVHKWIGEENQEHGKRSLYSFSWLQNTDSFKSGLNLASNAYFFISAYNEQLIKTVLKGILKDPETFCGSRVLDVQVKEVPKFTNEERFVMNSPILIKRRDDGKVTHVTFNDADFDVLLTENLKGKLSYVGLNSNGVAVKLDQSYAFPQTKLVDYKGVKNKTTLAPVVITGTPEQIAFAWLVGLGHSTGIGFGALK